MYITWKPFEFVTNHTLKSKCKFESIAMFSIRVAIAGKNSYFSFANQFDVRDGSHSVADWSQC